MGGGYEHVLPPGTAMPPRAEPVLTLDPTAAVTVEMVVALQERCSSDDNEEADFDTNALDSVLTGWVADGRLHALGGGRPLPGRSGFLDVGVLVAADRRQLGYGTAVIAATVDDTIALGHSPLYRCGHENIGSQRLCAGLGFERVLEI